MGLAKRKNEATARELIEALAAVHVGGEDLHALIKLTREGEDCERRVGILKASRDGASMPTELLRRDLVKFRCQCDAALSWPSHE